MPMQIRGTAAPNSPPTGLAERQLSVEMGSSPPKLWCGVPASIDPVNGRVQLSPPIDYVSTSSLPLSVANGGIPAGGSQYQVLGKVSATARDVAWQNVGARPNNNTVIGSGALAMNTTGASNTGIGVSALVLGDGAGFTNNTAVGMSALSAITGASTNNTAIGSVTAGLWGATGNNALNAANSSTYIGANIRAAANGPTNEIVIGANVVGHGSNTCTLGTDAITQLWCGGRNLLTTLAVANGGTGVSSFAVPQTNLLPFVVGNAANALAPSQTWGIAGNNPQAILAAYNSNDPTSYSVINFFKGRGTTAAPLPSAAGDVLGGIAWDGTPYTPVAQSPGQIDCRATEAFSATQAGCELRFMVTAPGVRLPRVSSLNAVANGVQLHLGSDNVGGIFSAFNTGDIGIVPSGTAAIATWWNGTTGDIWTSANITAGNFPSERRLKKDIAPYERGLDAVIALNPVQWHWNGTEGTRDDGTVHYGVIADEAAAAAPEAVVERDRIWGPGPDQRAPTRGIEDRVVVMLLVNAVKELAQRIAGMEARFAG